MRRVVAMGAAAAVALALASCRDAPEATVQPVPSTAPSPDATPSPDPVAGSGAEAAPQPAPDARPAPVPAPATGLAPDQGQTAVPAEAAAIDAAYLLDVLNGLFAAETQRIRHMLTTRERDDEWQAWLAALYSPDSHELQRRLFDDIAGNPELFHPPQEIRDVTITAITRVITARPDCVFVEFPFRREALLRGPPQTLSMYAAVVPHHGRADPVRNPTAWWFVSWLEYADGARAHNPCG